MGEGAPKSGKPRGVWGELPLRPPILHAQARYIVVTGPQAARG